MKSNRKLLCNINLLTWGICFTMLFWNTSMFFCAFRRRGSSRADEPCQSTQIKSNQVRRQYARVQTPWHNLSIGHQSNPSATNIHHAALLSHAGILRPVMEQQDYMSPTHAPSIRRQDIHVIEDNYKAALMQN